MKYYPVFVNMEGKRAVVVGGGKVAERKARTLIKAGALVEVISPAITKNLEKYRERGWIRHIKREYKRGDLKDALVVIAATSSKKINSNVDRDAKKLPRLINVVDTPSEGNFIAPSIVRRGPLTIAISTEGCSPAVSKAIRKEIEDSYSSEFARYLKFTGIIRKEAVKKMQDSKKRERFLKSLASEEVFKTLREKGFAEASKKVHHSYPQ